MPDTWTTAILAGQKEKYESGEITPGQYSQAEYKLLGRKDYMEAHPELFDLSLYGGDWRATPSSVYYNRVNAEINDKRNLLRQFSGPEATWMRWLIQKDIQSLTSERERLVGRKYEPRYEEPPMPDWMKDYLETSMPATPIQVEGRQRGRAEPTPQAATLRPLGAQEELSAEQLGMMAGYQAWGEAGSPYTYSEEAMKSMADWQRWWSPYVRQSQSLFPTKGKLKSSWMPALQK